MDIYTFIIELLRTTAWPIVVFILLILFRSTIVNLLMNLKRFEYGRFKIEIEKALKEIDSQTEKIPNEEIRKLKTNEQKDELEKLRKNYIEILKQSPTAVILESWRNIESELDRIGSKYLPDRKHIQTALLIKTLGEKNEISEEIRNMLAQLYFVRNEVAHPRSQLEVGESNALVYSQSAIKILSYLKEKQ